VKFPAFTARDWSLRTRLLLIAALAGGAPRGTEAVA
jgi:hypothetical protein